MTEPTAGTTPILLAFSGGLDTSFCVPWLAEKYGRPIVTLTVNTGGIDAEAARRHLVYAFCAEVIAEVALAPVRTELERLVLDRINE